MIKQSSVHILLIILILTKEMHKEEYFEIFLFHHT